MDHPPLANPDNAVGLSFSLISISTGMLAFITVNLELWIRCAAGGIATLSGIMAFMYYYYAIKEKKLTIKKLQEK